MGVKLTKLAVERAALKDVDYFMWCDELSGFGIRIYPSGKRVYLIQYRAAGRTRRTRIGLHGPLTCEQARKQAKALLGRVAMGEDPAEERATNRKAVTVRQLCEAYKAALNSGLVLGKRGAPKKPLTIRSDLGRIDRHIIPLLGNKRVRDLTAADLTRFIRDVTGGKTATVEKSPKLRGKSIVRGGRGAASRTAGLLGGILSFAVLEGIITTNPARGVPRPSSEVRTRRLTPSDYLALGRALEDAAERSMNPAAIAAIRLLALTGCRSSEVLNLRWDEIDEAHGAFRFIDSKTGASVRPIGSPAFTVLKQLERRPGSIWVLTGKQVDQPYGGMKGALRTILAFAGLSNVSLHTLRHSFASVAGDLGYGEAAIAALLGHAAGTVTSRYTHILDRVVIAAADHVAQEINSCMTTTSGGQLAQVEVMAARLLPQLADPAQKASK